MQTLNSFKRYSLIAFIGLGSLMITTGASADCNTDASAERRHCTVDAYTLISRMGDHGHPISGSRLAVGPNNHDILIHTLREGRLHTITELSFYARDNADLDKNVYKASTDYYRINTPMATFAGTLDQLKTGDLQITIKNRSDTGITASLISKARPVASQ